MIITDNNVAMLNQPTGKMFDGDLHTNTKSLGFVYDFKVSKYICGVALVGKFFVLTDGSCIPEGTDLHSIRIHLKAYAGFIDRPVYRVRTTIKIPNDRVNAIIATVSTPKKILFYIKGLGRSIGRRK